MINFRYPIGAKLLNSVSSLLPIKRITFYRATVLILTFISYFSYHVTRRSISIVKPVLHQDNCSYLIPPHDLNITGDNGNTWCNWKPFDGPNGKSLLGALDTAYLISYALFMFISGMIAERVNLRYFLSIGMIMVGVCNCLFGIAYYQNIHILAYFIVIQICSGMFSSTGWPNVATIVGNWFGPSKRGLIFGIWNSHVRFGNIAGAAIAGIFVDYNWGLSFIVPGLMIAIFGILMFIFLIPQPNDINLNIEKKKESDDKPLNNHSKAISFLDAIKIPGVIEFSLCLFFTKWVSYTFLYWLPMYIKEMTGDTSGHSAFLSIFFDVGGIFGGILAGYLSDRTGSGAITSVLFLIMAVPSLFLYLSYGTETQFLNELLQFIAGTFVNGPYSLITTAVSAELGTKIESKSALATVSAIIDGTGSIGSAVGPSLAGVLSDRLGWKYVFYMVICADIFGVISLLRISFNDLRKMRESRKTKTTLSTIEKALAETSQL